MSCPNNEASKPIVLFEAKSYMNGKYRLILQNHKFHYETTDSNDAMGNPIWVKVTRDLSKLEILEEAFRQYFITNEETLKQYKNLRSSLDNTIAAMEKNPEILYINLSQDEEANKNSENDGQ